MPTETRNRTRSPYAPALDLPPPFRLVTLREVGNAFAHAIQIAADEGAGTLVYVRRFDLVEFALVLEPDEPLRTGRRAFYAGLNALVDALIAYAPPEKVINVDWPAAIFVDGGLVGGAQLAWPAGVSEDAVTPWLVFGGMVRAFAMEGIEPGLRPTSATLEEEGFEDVGSGRLVESFARHFMVAVDAWQEQGFEAVARTYLSRLIPSQGQHREIDETGDLIIRQTMNAKVARRSLQEALTTAAWFDPTTGGPRL